MRRDVYELLDAEAPVFLDEELIERWKIGKLTKQDREDIGEFEDYLFGFFSKDKRWVMRFIAQYLNER